MKIRDRIGKGNQGTKTKIELIETRDRIGKRPISLKTPRDILNNFIVVKATILLELL